MLEMLPHLKRNICVPFVAKLITRNTTKIDVRENTQEVIDIFVHMRVVIKVLLKKVN